MLSTVTVFWQCVATHCDNNCCNAGHVADDKLECSDKQQKRLCRSTGRKWWNHIYGTTAGSVQKHVDAQQLPDTVLLEVHYYKGYKEVPVAKTSNHTKGQLGC